MIRRPPRSTLFPTRRSSDLLYIANGITTIRAMLGAPNQLVLRDRLAANELLGPTMYVAAPSLNGRSAPNPDRKSTRLNSSHANISYAVFCLKKKKCRYQC